MKSKLKIIIPVGIALIAIALAFVFIRFTPTETVDISGVIDTAQQYLIDQKYEQAIAEFEKAIQIDPMNADAYIGIAQAYEAIGDTESALEWLQKGYDLTGDTSLKDEIDRLSVRSAEAETTTTTAPETSTVATTPETTTTTAEVTTTTAKTTIETTASVLKIREGIETGQCGKNVYFTLDEDGTVYVYGTGDMYNYDATMIDFNNNVLGYSGDPSPFGGNDKIKHLVIESGVTSIGNSSFVYCYNLESIEISNSVTIIGEDAFEYCLSLDIKEIPSTVLTIKKGAFSNCNNIKKITIGSNTIDWYAFAYCEGLEEVYLTKDVQRIECYSFAGHEKVQKNFPKKIFIENPECLFYVEAEKRQDEVFYKDTVLYGYAGSTTEEYAKKYDRTFIALD